MIKSHNKVVLLAIPLQLLTQLCSERRTGIYNTCVVLYVLEMIRVDSIFQYKYKHGRAKLFH